MSVIEPSPYICCYVSVLLIKTPEVSGNVTKNLASKKKVHNFFLQPLLFVFSISIVEVITLSFPTPTPVVIYNGNKNFTIYSKGPTFHQHPFPEGFWPPRGGHVIHLCAFPAFSLCQRWHTSKPKLTHRGWKAIHLFRRSVARVRKVLYFLSAVLAFYCF